MNDIYKRLFTSIFLIFLLFIAFKNIIIFNFLLILILYQLFYESFNILKKIFKSKKKILFSYSFLALIFFIFLTVVVYLILNNEFSNAKSILIFIISISICSDVGGYVFGNLFKGKKISRISPNKTYSGMFGSYIFSLVIPYYVFNNIVEDYKIIIISLIISTITQLGDFFVSFIKRKAKIKDTGSILPGHGGLLDRFDGLIFAIPSGIFIYYIL